jgi:hypothetical protein
VRTVAFLIAWICASAQAQPVAAGADVIDKAIARLVPPPLEVRIDPRIPATIVLRWPAAADWMGALQKATSDAGLRVRPRFDLGQLEVELPLKADVKTASAQVADKPSTPAAAAPAFSLIGGQRLDLQLVDWAKRAGWQLIWSSNRTWMVPGTASISYVGSVDAAMEAAVADLYANGVPVRLDIWSANKVMEISHEK